MSGRQNEFSNRTKKATIERQGGVCAFCGVLIKTPYSQGHYPGEAHHLRPILHEGDDTVDNCVYLCWGDHRHLGHGMAPFGIDKQGGSSSTWVKLPKSAFGFWEKK